LWRLRLGSSACWDSRGVNAPGGFRIVHRLKHVAAVYIDSHCHLSFPELANDIDAVLARMRAQQVRAAVNVCTTLEEFPRVLALAERESDVYASVGVHPDSRDCREPDIETLVGLASHPRVVAIGETGLDYFRLQEPLEWQRDRFRLHIRAACASGLPLIIHTRAAAADTLRIMREENAAQAGGVMHCFTETLDVARAALDLGFYISISGIVTFKKAQEVQKVAQFVPQERLLIETDAPYLAPVPMRGRTNEPAFVPYVAGRIAELTDRSQDEVGYHCATNTCCLFNKIH
jgi:TatD DNase family protein